MRTLPSIGERLKSLRVEEGITLAELGGRVSLSPGYLSQVERDRTTPSLSTLTSIARALNVGLRYFFEIEEEAAYVVRSQAEQKPSSADVPIVRTSRTPETGSTRMVAQRIRLEPRGAMQELAQSPGEELVYVLSGELTITVGDEQFVLSAGDSIHYDALQPHRWENKAHELCNLIWSHAISRTARQTVDNHSE